MKKLLVLSILVMVGSVGFAYWQESKLIQLEELWPPSVQLEYRGASGEVRSYVGVVRIEGKVASMPGAPVLDATMIVSYTEEIGKQVGGGAHEVVYHFADVQFDAGSAQKRLLANMGMTRQLTELKEQRIVAIRHPDGRTEVTASPTTTSGNLLMQSFMGTEGSNEFPPDALSKGGTWNTQSEGLAIRHELEDFEKLDLYRCARITSQLETGGAAGGAAAARQPRITGNLTTHFDYSRGAVVRREGRQTISIPGILDMTMDIGMNLVSIVSTAPEA